MKEKFVQKMSIGVICFVVAVMCAFGFISSCLKGNIGEVRAIVLSLICVVPLGVVGAILFGDAYELMMEQSREHAETVKAKPTFGQPHHFKVWTEEEEAVMS